MYRTQAEYMQWLNRELHELEHLELKVIIFGTKIMGSIGRRVLEKLGKPPLCFLDNNARPEKADAYQYKVLKPENAVNEYKDATVYICSLNAVNTEQIQSQLTGLGYTNVKRFDVLLYYFRVKMRSAGMSGENFGRLMYQIYYRKDQPLVLESLGLIVTEKCSLRCKDCGALIPHYSAPKHYETKHIISSVEKLSVSVDAIQTIGIYGGEPLLFPDLAEVCEALVKLPNVRNINIVTNGTITLDDALAEKAASLGIGVSVSNYGPLSRKLDALIGILEKYHIAYEVYDQNQTWYKCALPAKQNRSHAENTKIYSRCFCGKVCPILQNERLYLCGYHSSAVESGHYSVADDDCIDLSAQSASNLRDQIAGLMQLDFPGICDYCTLADLEIVNRAEQA